MSDLLAGLDPPSHDPGGVPYCDTCGLFRTTVAQEMHKRAAEERAKRRQTHKPVVSTHNLPVTDIIGEIATWLL